MYHSSMRHPSIAAQGRHLFGSNLVLYRAVIVVSAARAIAPLRLCVLESPRYAKKTMLHISSVKYANVMRSNFCGNFNSFSFILNSCEPFV